MPNDDDAIRLYVEVTRKCSTPPTAPTTATRTLPLAAQSATHSPAPRQISVANCAYNLTCSTELKDKYADKDGKEKRVKLIVTYKQICECSDEPAACVQPTQVDVQKLSDFANWVKEQLDNDKAAVERIIDEASFGDGLEELIRQWLPNLSECGPASCCSGMACTSNLVTRVTTTNALRTGSRPAKMDVLGTCAGCD